MAPRSVGAYRRLAGARLRPSRMGHRHWAALIGAALLLETAAIASPDPWLGRDKLWHASISAGMATSGYAGLRWLHLDRTEALLFAGAATLAVGGAKELSDSYGGGRVSARDLAWDAIGTGVGLLVGWAIEQWLGSSDATPVSGAAHLATRARWTGPGQASHLP